ncbi:MAG TPA: PepSY domain-containing protein [Xanthobacteraceae bacterium]|nr:PepSY domain-containing protein [Xanthobacteraceae bacterium]
MSGNLRAAMTAGLIATAALVGLARADDSKTVHFTGERYAKDAKVTLDDARAIALKAYAGEIVSQELEKERGGSGLRYSFDIKNGKSTHEVGVDAKTGKLLENSVEGAHPD